MRDQSLRLCASTSFRSLRLGTVETRAGPRARREWALLWVPRRRGNLLGRSVRASGRRTPEFPCHQLRVILFLVDGSLSRQNAEHRARADHLTSAYSERQVTPFITVIAFRCLQDIMTRLRLESSGPDIACCSASVLGEADQ